MSRNNALDNAQDVTNNRQVTKAQKQARKARRLRKRETAIAAARPPFDPAHQPGFWTLVDWIQERDRRNEVIHQEAIRRAIANVSLGQGLVSFEEHDTGRESTRAWLQASREPDAVTLTLSP